MKKSFLEHFEGIEDPRVTGLVTYPLPEILLGALVGVMYGAEDWEDVVLICKEKLVFLKALLAYSEGIASLLPSNTTVDAGHGRIDERICRSSEDIAWLREQHPAWVSLRSIAAVTVLRTNKKTGQTSREARFYISSLSADPERLLAVTRAHWSIENNLPWMLDVVLGEDACQTRKNHAALNLATVRKTVLALCRKNPEKIPVKRKIMKAALNNDFLANLLR